MPASKSPRMQRGNQGQSPRGGQALNSKSRQRPVYDLFGNKKMHEQESVDAEDIHEFNESESDLAPEGEHIEADGEFDAEYNIIDMVGEEDLEAELAGDSHSFQQQQSKQEHNKEEKFKGSHTLQEMGTKKEISPPTPQEDSKPKKFVIPKKNTGSTEQQDNENKWPKQSAAASESKAEGNDKLPFQHEPSVEDTLQIEEDNQDFQAEVDADIEAQTQEDAKKEVTQDHLIVTSGQRVAADYPLEIPEGKDSLAHIRESYPWQIRIYPLKQADAVRADFGKIWTMAQSSSVTWTSRGDGNGVAEFLLEDKAGIQMFMRKVMWHPFSKRYMTVEVVERDQSVTEDGSQELIHNRALFKYDNHTARKLIKTYYPAANGEVTERSLYVNNVGMGVSADIMKAIFPCALKIGVAKASKDTSSALVQTESEEAAFNYLIVYQQVCVNGLDLELSTVKHDWQGARDKYHKTEAGKTARKPEGEKQTVTNVSKLDETRKRAKIASPNAAPLTKKERKGENSSAPRGRGRGAVASQGKGRGRGQIKSAGRGLLPKPVEKGKGLLPPPPLMSLPVHKPTPINDLLLLQERERRMAELQEETRHLDPEPRGSFSLVSRRPESAGQIPSRFSLMERLQRMADPAPRSLPRSLEYEEEQEPPRRPLLAREGYVAREEWMRETANYQRPRPLVDDFDSRQSYPSDRPEEAVTSRRLAAAPQRPYLLEVPEEKDGYADHAPSDTYYGNSAVGVRQSRIEPESRRTLAEERRTLLGRGGLLDRYSLEEERVAPRSRELLDYSRERAQLSSLYSTPIVMDDHGDTRRSHLTSRYPAERHGSAVYGYEGRF